MQVLRTIPTPWAPHAVMFSRDGTRLAVAGGVWYGNGGILLLDLATGHSELFPCARLPGSPGRRTGAPTASSVCFSADDRHLVASIWTSSQHLVPTIVSEVYGFHLTHRQTFHSRHEGSLRDPTPTGVLIVGKSLTGPFPRLRGPWEPEELGLPGVARPAGVAPGAVPSPPAGATGVGALAGSAPG
jgi:hypothetical protein